MATYRSPSGYARTGIGPGPALARLVDLATEVAAGLIAVAIVLRVVGASTHTEIVRWIVDAGRWLTTPFHGLFSAHGDWHYILNWGLAALVYLIIGRMVARALARI
jgi:hypothetical protein